MINDVDKAIAKKETALISSTVRTSDCIINRYSKLRIKLAATTILIIKWKLINDNTQLIKRDNIDQVCSICLDSLNDNDNVFTIKCCSNNFCHFYCLEDLVTIKEPYANKCPACRVEIFSDDKL